METNFLLLMLVIVMVPILHTEGAKVLLLPLVGTSHTMTFAKIGEALIKKGHQVTAYINGDCQATKRLTDVNIELITYNNTEGGCFQESEHWAGGATKFLDKGLGKAEIFLHLKSKYPLFKVEVEHALADQKAIRKMKKMDFDVIIAEGSVFNKHVYVLAYILGKPIISTIGIFNAYEAGVPTIPSIYPMTNTGVTAKMTFSERLKNFAVLIAERFFMSFLLPPNDDNLVMKYASDRPYKSLSQIAGESRVWLLMSDDVIDYAKVTVPSVVNVGGLNTKPADPLTGDLKAWADAADSGLIIVSFGSGYILPKRLIKVLMESFRDLPQTVIMRHTDTNLRDIPENVHLLNWMPQNDLLGHPNTRLFITHCGCNGQFEALYHSVPMVGLPMFGDQLHNAKRAEYHGIGITLKLLTLTVHELSDGIAKILGDPSYSKRVVHLSKIFRDRPMTPMETAVYWIERVVKYGCEELRPVSVDLPSYQFWAVDIMVFVMVVGGVLMYMVWKLFRCLCWSCCKQKQTPPPYTREGILKTATEQRSKPKSQ